MKIINLLCLGFYAAFVTAQNISQCALACVSQAAARDGCGSFANITCVCTSAQFQEDARTCLMALCPSDLSSLEGLQATECAPAGLSASGTPSSTGTFIATGVSSGTGTSLSIPSTGTSAASTTASGSVSGSSSATGSGSSAVSTGSASPSSGTNGAPTAPSPTPTSGEKRIEIPLGMGLAVAVMLTAGLLG